ncbi:unnamed protein product, partial [Darwinula stevensoni]
MTRFNLSYNEGIQELPAGVFGEVSFEELFIYRTSISSVHPHAILPSKDRLWDLQMGYGVLKSFPWDILPEFKKIIRISLYNNVFNAWQLLQSESLEIIILSRNNISYLEPGFHLPSLRVLDVGLTVNTKLNLSRNKIEELTEEVFLPMFDVLSQGNGSIDLRENPIRCDCSMAWIVHNPSFLASVLGECTNGTDLQDLDPTLFEEFCNHTDLHLQPNSTEWAQNPCPDSVDIFPCTCNHEESTNATVVDCSNVSSIDKVSNIFNKEVWPSTELTRFNLSYNEGIQELPAGVFGEVSFEELFIYRTSINSVHPHAILPLKDRLLDLQVGYGVLESFPWDTLPEFKKIFRISLHNNVLNAWPLLQSLTVNTKLILSRNKIEELTEEVFLPMFEVLSQGNGSIDLR